MTTKSTPRGIAGNAARDGVPLRDWASRSYSATDGRSASSLADQFGRGSPSTTHSGPANAQIPSGFERADRKRTTDSRPVRTRPFTEQYD
jgi:hypothetical protein